MRIIRTAMTASAVASGFFGAMAAHRVVMQRPRATRQSAAHAVDVCAEAAQRAVSVWVAEQAASLARPAIGESDDRR